MYCLLGDDGSVISSFACPQPGIPGAVEIDDGDPRAIAYASGNTPAQLVAYAQVKQRALATGGFAANVAAAGSPPEIAYADTTVVGRTDLGGLNQLAVLSGASFSAQWVQSEGNLTLSAAQVTTLAAAVGMFYASTYAALAGVLDAIAAGKIKTQADVDAAAWPANHN